MNLSSGTTTITNVYNAGEFCRFWILPAHNNGTVVFDAAARRAR